MTILRKTIKTILVGLVSSIGFLAVAATVLFFTVDQQNIKDYLESKFYAKTGYTLKILGKADFGLSPHLSLRVYNAHITPPNAKENTPSFIQVKSIKMALKWPELLDGKVYIKKLTIEQPVVHLIIDKENQQIPALEHAYLQDNHPIQLVAHLTDRNPLLTQTLLTKPKKIPKHKKKPRFNPDLHVKAFSVKDATIIYENKKKNQKVVLEHLSMHNPTFGLRRKTHQSHSLAPWLHLLETHGRLAISDIWMGQLHINQVKMHYNLTDGKLTLSPVRYRFNDTPGVANFILYDKGNHLRVGLKNRLNDANLVYSPINDDRSSKGLAFATMPLLLDIDSGKLSVNTYIYADITDLADLDKHLNGSIRLALHDGDIKRFNIAKNSS